jgi:hypothetical protein
MPPGVPTEADMNTERKKDISTLVFRQEIKHTTWVEGPPARSSWHGDVAMAAAIAYVVWLPPALLSPKPSQCRQDHLGPHQAVFFEVVGGHSDRAIGYSHHGGRCMWRTKCGRARHLCPR